MVDERKLVSTKPIVFDWQRALLARADLNTSTRCVGMALSVHYNQAKGVAWPGNARLAAETAMSERSVQTHLGELERRGLIERRAGAHGAGRRAQEWALSVSVQLSPTGNQLLVGQESQPETSFRLEEVPNRKPASGWSVPTGNQLHPQPETSFTPTQREHQAVPSGLHNTKEERGSDDKQGTDPSGGPTSTPAEASASVGTTDDEDDNLKAERVVLALQGAQSLEDLTALRSEHAWAFANRSYVERARAQREDELIKEDPNLPDFLR